MNRINSLGACKWSVLILVCSCVSLALAQSAATSPRNVLVSRNGSTVRPSGTLTLATASANRNNFVARYAKLWSIAQARIADVKRVGLKSIPRGPKPTLSKDKYLNTLRSKLTWGVHDSKMYAVRMTLIPVTRKGVGLSPTQALRHFTKLYHTATSFYNQPNYLPNTMNTNAPPPKPAPQVPQIVYYVQEVAGSFYFRTQEEFRPTEADFVCFYWPSDDESNGAYGVDIVWLVPSTNGQISHLLFLTVYDDPHRAWFEKGDAKRQHVRLLSAMRRDQ